MLDLVRLDPDKILVTARRLEKRIRERFGDSGLSRVADRLVALALHARATCAEIRKPNRPLRIASYSVIALLLVSVLAVIAISMSSAGATRPVTWIDLVQAAEASINDLVLLGAAVYFFMSFETRQKRRRIVHALHDLRGLAHLIDVHQLTKTPELLGHHQSTESSPLRTLTPFETSRYLDYCSEMLSLTAKIAALYGDGFDDADAMEAVNDLEELCIGLQQKVWQKMMLLQPSVGQTTSL